MNIKLTNQYVAHTAVIGLSALCAHSYLPDNVRELIKYHTESDPAAYKFGHTAVFSLPAADNKIQKLIFCGLGAETLPTSEKLRELAGNTVRLLSKENTAEAIYCLPDDVLANEPDNLAACVQGLVLGAYKFDILKSGKQPSPIAEIAIICAHVTPVLDRTLKEALILSANVVLARDLTNLPANILTPNELVDKAEKLTKRLPNINCRILDMKAMGKLNMNALLAVAAGSDNASYTAVITYRGNKLCSEMLALVGKGITFDSGGISLKPADGMWEMRDDMAGAAAVLAAIKTIAELQLPINVMAVMPCVENMPSGNAFRPGDVFEAMNGKTIEIRSTDAEGRLVLADAVHYAETLGATKVVDIATLTGACAIAVGNSYAATITNNLQFHSLLETAAAKTGEKIWRLPAEEQYKELIKSDFADLKNSAGRPAGVITGGLFIGEFVTKDWIHIDIGSTADTDKTSGYLTNGATGYGVRLLVQLAREVFSC